MKQITKQELLKALGKKKLARLYCKGYSMEQLESRMERYPSPQTLDKIFQVHQVKTNGFTIINTINKVQYTCDTRHSRYTEIEFQGMKGYAIEFLNKDTNEPYSCVLYIA